MCILLQQQKESLILKTSKLYIHVGKDYRETKKNFQYVWLEW